MDYNQDKQQKFEEEKEEGNEVLSFETLKYLKELNSLFWLSVILCMILYATFISFKYISTGWLTSTVFADLKDKEIAEEKAGIYISIPFLISTFLIPLFGYLIDIFGQRGYLILVSSIVSLISYILFYFLNPLIGFSLLGLAYSVYSIATWAAISLAVGKKRQVIFILKINFFYRKLLKFVSILNKSMFIS